MLLLPTSLILRLRKHVPGVCVCVCVCVCVYVCVLSCSVMSDSLQLHGLQPARLLCLWGFSRQEYWSELSGPTPGHLSNPGIEPRSPTLQVDSLLSEPPGKHGVGSLSLLQGRMTFIVTYSHSDKTLASYSARNKMKLSII